MKSPFPGMDPYIEACGLWESFHNHLIEDIYRAIAQVLPRGYTVDTEVRSYVVLMESEGKKEYLRGSGELKNPRFVADQVRERFVEIHVNEPERILVTCIEALSLSNKRPNSEGWSHYLRKRQAMLLGQANFIEIDLLRGGQKMPMIDPWPDSPYTLLVSRRVDAPQCRVWPAHFRRRLPVIPIPLAYLDADLSLDLQPLIDSVYAIARYDERIDYSRPLNPALPAADADWVREQLSAHKARK